MPKYHVIATLRPGDGTERTENLGIYEATMGTKAKEAARAQNAKKLGIRRLARGGGWTGKWTFRSTLAHDEKEHPEPSAASLKEMPEITDQHVRLPGRGRLACGDCKAQAPCQRHAPDKHKAAMRVVKTLLEEAGFYEGNVAGDIQLTGAVDDQGDVWVMFRVKVLGIDIEGACTR